MKRVCPAMHSALEQWTNDARRKKNLAKLMRAIKERSFVLFLLYKIFCLSFISEQTWHIFDWIRMILIYIIYPWKMCERKKLTYSSQLFSEMWWWEMFVLSFLKIKKWLQHAYSLCVLRRRKKRRLVHSSSLLFVAVCGRSVT